MGRLVPISRTRAAGLVALTLLTAGAFALAPAVGLMLAPALLLIGLLLAGFMPGERVLERLAARGVFRRRPLIQASRPRLTLVVRRTGRFVTQALAMRPPPARPLVFN
jgi:hypothetical protein